MEISVQVSILTGFFSFPIKLFFHKLTGRYRKNKSNLGEKKFSISLTLKEEETTHAVFCKSHVISLADIFSKLSIDSIERCNLKRLIPLPGKS